MKANSAPNNQLICASNVHFVQDGLL